ncbi:uncharacterized protein [Leptinotarsa decemlineata]|uniref:uncharacterized protein n=1 Tax=Leptinotarsa decemlineata TaxID=7539 RepID=UPI003D307F0D
MTKVAELCRISKNEYKGPEYVKNYAKQMLRNSLFVGVFKEKRFVESLGSYRDVVNISEAETDFIENLLSVLRKINQEFFKTPWVGITGPNTIGVPVGYCLWVVLPKEVFGKYWYRVKTVEFFKDEIRLKLEVVRQFQNQCFSKNSSTVDNNFVNYDLKANFSEVIHQINFENVKHCTIFIILFSGTIIVGAINITKYLLEYLLQFMKELSNLIRVMTPIIINFMNVILKAFFGFYQMIITLCHGKPQSQPIYNSYISFDPRYMDNPRFNRYFNNDIPPYSQQRIGDTIRPISN